MFYGMTSNTTTHPILMLIAALASICLVAFKFASATGLRTNENFIAVDKPGGGKGAIIKTLFRIFEKTKAAGVLGARLLASDAAMIKALAAAPNQVCVFCHDEIGKLFESIRSGGSITGIDSLILQLYDSMKIVKAYADPTKNIIIDGYHFMLVGLSTPQVLWNNLDIKSLNEGLLSRFLVYSHAGKLPATNYEIDTAVPCEIVKFIDDLWNLEVGNDEYDEHGKPQILLNSDDATKEAEKKLDRIIRDYADDLSEQEQWKQDIYVRFMTHVTKIKMAHHISLYGPDSRNQLIKIESLYWATVFVKFITDNMIVMCESLMKNKITTDLDKLIRSLERIAKKKGLTMVERSILLKTIPKERLDQTIKEGVEKGVLQETEDPNSKRGKTLISLTEEQLNEG
jgi:hypothetical protein